MQNLRADRIEVCVAVAILSSWESRHRVAVEFGDHALRKRGILANEQGNRNLKNSMTRQVTLGYALCMW